MPQAFLVTETLLPILIWLLQLLNRPELERCTLERFLGPNIDHH